VGARLEVGLELVPELGRLILDVPLHVLVARAEVALFGAGWFLVTADADDNAGVVVLVEHRLEGVLLEDAAALDARGLAVRVGPFGLERLFVLADDELEVPLAAE